MKDIKNTNKLYTTRSSHLWQYIDNDITNGRQNYKCFWCQKTHSIKYNGIPSVTIVINKKQISDYSCSNPNDYNHFMYDKLNSKNIYSQCLKCNKTFPEIV